MKTDICLALFALVFGGTQLFVVLWMRSQMKINRHAHSLFVILDRRLDGIERRMWTLKQKK